MSDSTSPESERVSAYLDTVGRLEPDIAMVDRDATLTSIAISLKRIADGQALLIEQLSNIEMTLRWRT